MGQGIVLFAHGSRDPLWRAPLDAVAARVRERSPGVRVACAFLEMMTPDLRDAVASLASEGVTAVRVLPMFLGVGKHAREDLPVLVESLRGTFPAIAFTLEPAVGEDPRLIEKLADIALG